MNNVCLKLRLLVEDRIQRVYRYALCILSAASVRGGSLSAAGRLETTRQARVQGRSVKDYLPARLNALYGSFERFANTTFRKE
jgi:hypothetical protein